MRTTIDIEESMFRIVKGLAKEKKKSCGYIISKLIREALEPKFDRVKTRNGFPLFEVEQTKTLVTNDLIEKIKEEEEI
jgi:hypothetical protein